MERGDGEREGKKRESRIGRISKWRNPDHKGTRECEYSIKAVALLNQLKLIMNL